MNHPPSVRLICLAGLVWYISSVLLGQGVSVLLGQGVSVLLGQGVFVLLGQGVSVLLGQGVFVLLELACICSTSTSVYPFYLD